MSGSDVEIVRQVLEAGPGQAAGVMADLLHPAVHLDMSKRACNPGVFDGYEGIARWREEVNDEWAAYRMQPEEIYEGEDGIVAVARELARGRRDDGARLDERITFMFTLREGRVREIRYYDDLSRALADAGCAPPP